MCFFKQKTAYEMRISDWSSDVCSSDLVTMHTGGEPLRIVTSGYPKLQGSRLLDKRCDALANHDAFRRLLMHEPRGHAEMYGAAIGSASCRERVCQYV